MPFPPASGGELRRKSRPEPEMSTLLPLFAGQIATSTSTSSSIPVTRSGTGDGADCLCRIEVSNGKCISQALPFHAVGFPLARSAIKGKKEIILDSGRISNASGLSTRPCESFVIQMRFLFSSRNLARSLLPSSLLPRTYRSS